MQKKMIKIEMGIVQDIQKVSNNAKSAISTMDSAIQKMDAADKAFLAVESKADAASAAANKSTSDAVKVQTQIGTILEKAEKAAKALGVAPNLVEGYSEIDKMYDTIEAKIKEVNSFDFEVAKRVLKSF